MYNSKNKWFAGLLALLLTLTVGYALFSEKIIINGTAQAKGSFDIQATCTKGLGPELITVGVADSVDAEQGGFENDTCSVVNDEVIISTDLLYPSATRAFTLYFKNNGTIPAKQDLSKIVDNSRLCYKEKATDAEECLNFSDAPAARSWYYDYEPLFIKTSTGTLVTPEEDLFFEKYYDEDNGILTLEPGDTVLYYVMVTWNKDDELQKEYLKINLDIDFSFEQASNN